MPEPQGADDLYALDFGEFTAGRNALAKRLKSQGRVEEAQQVEALRKPPLTAWALNQVARNHEKLVEEVLHSGRQLHDAMSQTFEGDRAGFAVAREAERSAIEAGAEAGAQYLAAAGHRPGEDARQKMTETLRSATIDDDTANLLQRGVLDADKTAVGFGFGPVPSIGDEAVRPRQSGRKTARSERSDSARQRQLERRRNDLSTEVERLAERMRAAHRMADEAGREADRLAKQAAAADDEVADARRRLQALDEGA